MMFFRAYHEKKEYLAQFRSGYASGFVLAETASPEENQDRLIEPQDILVGQAADVHADLGLRTVVILSTISRHVARNPLRSFGSTGRRNKGASVSSVVKAQMVIESVASKLSSCTMTTGRGLPRVVLAASELGQAGTAAVCLL